MARSLSAYGAKMYAEMQLAIAETYGVPLSSKMFSVEPSITQELNDAITAKADFLQRINVIPVTEIKGEKVFIGVSGPVTGRTNTKTTDREAKDASELDNTTYELSSTESDVGLPYAKIDAWAKFPDFHQRYSAAVQKQIALDRIMVGFHGLKAAAQTDIAAYPNAAGREQRLAATTARASPTAGTQGRQNRWQSNPGAGR
jgi:P2 family phage major capsid protein